VFEQAPRTIGVMPAAPDDWRRRFCSELDLPPGAILVLKRYRAPSERWDHEHCLFCWAKFMDPDLSEASRQFIEANPDVLTEGYTLSEEPELDDWVCPQCVEDFAEEYQLRIVDGRGEDPSGAEGVGR
jgi:hypothetical protein